MPWTYQVLSKPVIIFFKSSPEDIFSIFFFLREEHPCEKEASISCLPYVPGLEIVHARIGLGIVCAPGTEPAT